MFTNLIKLFNHYNKKTPDTMDCHVGVVSLQIIFNFYLYPFCTFTNVYVFIKFGGRQLYYVFTHPLSSGKLCLLWHPLLPNILCKFISANTTLGGYINVSSNQSLHPIDYLNKISSNSPKS